ncbi:rhomboid family protein [Polystyrenella longa]|nr:rhomboid family intramembrane serine protease [Polystyrenella longa]
METATEDKKKRPWVTALACAICSLCFFSLFPKTEMEKWQALVDAGLLSMNVFWNGEFWVLITSTFIHFALWHFAFNIYWLWVLGSRMELVIGSLPFLGFYLAAAWISTSLQMTGSGETGIGFSGVGYAMFGFMWPTRHHYPTFKEVLTPSIIRLFVSFMIGCIFVTYLNLYNIGNVAHVSGFLFGGAIAGFFVLKFKRSLQLTGIIALGLFSMVPLFWRTINASSMKSEAYQAHVAEDYERAIECYSELIELEPDNAWAHINRSDAYLALGQYEKAEADSEQAHKIDPDIEETLQQ